MLKSYGYAEIGMDHFALPTDSLCLAATAGKLHRNFMGYTHQHTQILIGLGVSSISDSYFAFAQNVKTVEEYLSLVDSGEIPVVKGHILTDDDLVIRQYILDIMCKGTTTLNLDAESSAQIFAGLARLEQLVDDGLISLNFNELTVTPAGKRFLRNICMALDARFWAEKPSTPLFSTAD